MLPMKLNFSDDDIHVDGLTVDQMNRSVPEFVSQYYIVNKKATEQEKERCRRFPSLAEYLRDRYGLHCK